MSISIVVVIMFTTITITVMTMFSMFTIVMYYEVPAISSEAFEEMKAQISARRDVAVAPHN